MNLNIFGISYTTLRERYLKESEFILLRAIRVGHATEETRKHAQHSLSPKNKETP